MSVSTSILIESLSKLSDQKELFGLEDFESINELENYRTSFRIDGGIIIIL